MRLVAKHAEVGYQTPGQRPGCRNCMYTPAPCNRRTTALYCSHHRIEVTSGGICPDFTFTRYKLRQLDDRTLPLELPQVGEPA